MEFQENPLAHNPAQKYDYKNKTQILNTPGRQEDIDKYG